MGWFCVSMTSCRASPLPIDALKNFSGNASHQIRTPLTIIKTQIALAQRTDKPEEINSALTACNTAIGDAERTLSQMMLLARLDERASKEMQKSSIDLALLARETTMALVPQASEAGFDLGFEGEEECICQGDAVLIGELLKNLIDNAVKHAIGGNEITVHVRSLTSTEMSWACLEVQDNGPGMPEEALKITDRFARHRGHGEGNGLGLAIVSEIVSAFGGRMQLENTVERGGCIIRILLPTV